VSGEREFDHREIDEILSSRIRLAAVSLLARCEEAEFTWIRDQTGTTDGNLATHCRKLEDAGYIAVRKAFAGRKPVTWYSLTELGREALVRHAHKLAALLSGGAEPTKERHDE